MRVIAVVGVLVIGLAGQAVAEDQCDQCKDLCRLMDQYQQKEILARIYGWWATSTARPADLANMPADVGVEAKKHFDHWKTWRKHPCELAPPKPGAQQQEQEQDDTVTDLTTSGEQDCEVFLGGDPTIAANKLSSGDNLTKFREDTNCKPIADATIAHEEQHRVDCMKAYAEGTPEKMADQSEKAEREVRGHQKHMEVLRDAIRTIVSKKGCGWQPTRRQRKNIDANMPTPDQIMKMSKRGWKSAKALSRGKR